MNKIDYFDLGVKDFRESKRYTYEENEQYYLGWLYALCTDYHKLNVENKQTEKYLDRYLQEKEDTRQTVNGPLSLNDSVLREHIFNGGKIKPYGATCCKYVYAKWDGHGFEFYNCDNNIITPCSFTGWEII